jgi:hypothetical protein
MPKMTEPPTASTHAMNRNTEWIVLASTAEIEKRKRPRLFESWDALEQPSPKNCSQLPYVLIWTVGIARTGYCGNMCTVGRDTSGLVRKLSNPSNLKRWRRERDSNRLLPLIEHNL